MDVDWSKLPKQPQRWPIASFFVGAWCYCYCDDLTYWVWPDDQWLPAGPNPAPVTAVDRVIFHDTDRSRKINESFLLGFNTFPLRDKPGTSRVYWKHGYPILDTFIRCFLQHYFESTGNETSPDPNGSLGEAVGIRVLFNPEGVKNFYVSHSAQLEESNQSRVDILERSGKLNLKDALSQLSKPESAPLQLGEGTEEIHTQASILLRGLLAEKPGTGALAKPSADLLHAISVDQQATLMVRFCNATGDAPSPHT